MFQSILICLIIYFQNIGFSAQHQPEWKQYRPNHWRATNDVIDNNETLEECINNKKCLERLLTKDKPLKSIFIDGLHPIEDIVKRYQYKKFDDSAMIDIPDEAKGLFYKSSHLPTCTCDMRYELRDLGQNYYPRYVPSAVCTPEVCWNSLYRCKPRHYKMYFLKHRDESSDEILPEPTGGQPVHGPLVPDQLRKEWVFEAIKVAVSCECSP